MKWWMRNLESMIEPFFRIVIPFHDFSKATARSRIFWCCILLFRKQNQPHEKPNIQQRLFFFCFFFANIKNNAVCIFSFELLPSSTRRIKKTSILGNEYAGKQHLPWLFTSPENCWPFWLLLLELYLERPKSNVPKSTGALLLIWVGPNLNWVREM